MENKLRDTLKCTLLAVPALLTLAPVCFADGFSVGIGTDYSSGKYGGTERTRITSIPMNAKYVAGPLTFKLSVAWINVSGTGVIIPSGLGGIGGSGGSGESGSSGGTVGVFGCAADNRSGARKPGDNGPCATTVVAGVAAAVRRTEQGFGDTVAAATYNALNSKGLSIDVTGRVKFATASDTKGLGSGKMDYALQIEAEQSIGKGYFNGGLGYKILGDPSGVSLNNVWYGSVGGGFKFSDATTAGVSYDYATAARSGGTALQEISFYASQRLSKNFKLNAYIFTGLSNASPDWGAGIGLGYAY